MKSPLSLADWNRIEHFNFFRQFDEPFFGLTTQLECTGLYKLAQASQTSFFLRYLHACSRAVNQIKNLRYRIEGDQVMVYDTVHISSTIGRPDGTFGFSFIPHQSAWDDFLPSAQQEVERVKNSRGLGLSKHTARTDTVHYSAIPWSSFSSISHARNYQQPDSAPKITFGRTSYQGSKLMLPLSVHLNHALADAQHLALFLEAFQEYCLPERS